MDNGSDANRTTDGKADGDDEYQMTVKNAKPIRIAGFCSYAYPLAIRQRLALGYLSGWVSEVRHMLSLIHTRN